MALVVVIGDGGGVSDSRAMLTNDAASS